MKSTKLKAEKVAVQKWKAIQKKSGCPKWTVEKVAVQNEKQFKLNNLPAWYVSIAIWLIQPAKCQLGAVYV